MSGTAKNSAAKDRKEALNKAMVQRRRSFEMSCIKLIGGFAVKIDAQEFIDDKAAGTALAKLTGQIADKADTYTRSVLLAICDNKLSQWVERHHTALGEKSTLDKVCLRIRADIKACPEVSFFYYWKELEHKAKSKRKRRVAS